MMFPLVKFLRAITCFRLPPVIVLLLLTASGLRMAQAQLAVNLTMERRSFVSLESVPVKVTVTNNIGRNVVLGGPGNSSWLGFEITCEGKPVSVIRAVAVSPIVLRAGDSLERTFSLERHYFLSESGTYSARASAYFPELQRYNSSKSVRFTMQSPRTPVFEQTFIVPQGYRMAGKYRRYQLSTFNDTSKTLLFLSLLDEETKMVMSRAPLSDVITEREIQPLVDPARNLHMIYLGSPTVWVYQRVNPDGKVEEQRFYRSRGGAPKLMAGGDGNVMVTGGILYDPAAEKPASAQFRRLSDRP